MHLSEESCDIRNGIGKFLQQLAFVDSNKANKTNKNKRTSIIDSRISNQPSSIFLLLSLTAITSEATMMLKTKIALTVKTPHEQQHEQQEQRSHLQRRRRW